jgi:hypothetical protein
MRLAVIVPNDCTVDLRNLEHRRLHCRNSAESDSASYKPQLRGWRSAQPKDT